MRDFEIDQLTIKGRAQGWGILYRKAFDDNGELYFPERLSWEFLNRTRMEQGSYIFSNQYLNEVIPDEKRVFKKEWIRYYSELPKVKNTFAFIDPACSLNDGADNTALVIIDVDVNNIRYVRVAQRFKILPTEIINLCFKVFDNFTPSLIGVEDVAFQRMLVLSITEEMRKRNKFIPIKGIRPPGDKTKEMRIMGLMPRLEWGSLLFSQGLHDLEDEMSAFPRGSKDDLLDALEGVNSLAFPPQLEKKDERPHPSSPDYEKWYIHHGLKNRGRDTSGAEDVYSIE